MRSASLLMLAVSLLTLSGCGLMEFKVSNYPLIIRDPAMRTCFEVKVMSWEERTYSEDQCDKIIARGIILTSDAWKMIRTDIQKNCQTAQCKQLTGAADGLFIAIDEALHQVP